MRNPQFSQKINQRKFKIQLYQNVSYKRGFMRFMNKYAQIKICLNDIPFYLYIYVSSYIYIPYFACKRYDDGIGIYNGIRWQIYNQNQLTSNDDD